MVSPQPIAADLSYAVALIPNEPLRSTITRASLAVTQRVENRNVIDDVRFPAHISLALCGTDAAFVPELIGSLDLVAATAFSGELVAERLRIQRGFLAVDCGDGGPIGGLQARVIDACATLHGRTPRLRPHLIERLPRLDAEERRLLDKYGTYKVAGRFHAHLSVASVRPEDAAIALEIARQHLAVPIAFRVAALQLVDVGHANEQWQVLKEWRAP